MLSEILSKDECAKCKICCCFDSSDIWEAPVITDEMAENIVHKQADQNFVIQNNVRILKMEKEPNEDLYYCSLLDRKKGCLMGDEKPFDCKIWPFRVMDFNGHLVITLSPVCPVVKARPLDKIMELSEKIAPLIFEQAKKNPDIVKPYINGYPIIAVKTN